MPRVSIVIPTYNSARYLAETLESILKQSFEDYEIIIVDDGSTDNTKEVLKRYEDSISYVFQDNSGGPSRPRNTGISIANGELISFFDSDDIMLPGKLEASVGLFDIAPQIGMVFSNFMVCDEAERVKPGTFLDHYAYFHSMTYSKIGEREYVYKGEEIFNGLFFENFIGLSGVLARKDVFSRAGYFDEQLSTSEDRDMWFRIGKKYDVGYIDIVGHCYRNREGSLTKRGIECEHNRITVIERYRTGIRKKIVRKRADQLIAQCNYGIGYHYQTLGCFSEARRYYFKSIKGYLNWYAARGLVITTVGPKVIKMLKNYRDLKLQ